jgi:hypothetical protein
LYPGCPRLLWSFGFCLLYLIATPLTVAADSSQLELWFEYDGHPVELSAPPQIDCLQQKTRMVFDCAAYRDDHSGRYWIARPPSGDYVLRVRVDQNKNNDSLMPGDLYRDYPFRVEPGTSGPFLVSLQKVLALQRPVSSSVPVEGLNRGCEEKLGFSVPIFSLFPRAGIDFSWQPLSSGSHYQYSLWRVRCRDGFPLEQVYLRNTRKNHVLASIPPSAPGEFYRLEVQAVHDQTATGRLILHDASGGTDSALQFVVTDPLIDRRWIYYGAAGLPVLFLLWLIAGLFQGPAVTPESQVDDIRRRRPLKPYLVTLLLMLLGAGGYSQRATLSGWLEQGWLVAAGAVELGWNSYAGEQQDREVATQGDATVRTGAQVKSEPPRLQGRWQGVVISSTPRPFTGSRRRAEIRLQLDEDSAQVAFLQNGHWREVTGKAFQVQRLGDGVTLFGHIHRKHQSELWTISIQRRKQPGLGLSLDRMITRRDPTGGSRDSQRLRASGEVLRVSADEL